MKKETDPVKRLAILERHNAELMDERDQALDLATKNRVAIATITAQRDKYKKALEIYAKKDNWRRQPLSSYAEVFEETGVVFFQDGFAIAQAALKED